MNSNRKDKQNSTLLGPDTTRWNRAVAPMKPTSTSFSWKRKEIKLLILLTPKRL